MGVWGAFCTSPLSAPHLSRQGKSVMQAVSSSEFKGKSGGGGGGGGFMVK